MVSVVIPVHNYGRFVGRALASVLNQTYKNIEVIIVDDGSTDETPNILRGIHHDRVRIFYNENRGVSYTRNFGAYHSRGHYIAFLDADDEFLPENINRKVKTAISGGFKVVISDFYIQHPDGRKEVFRPHVSANFLNDLLEMKTSTGASFNMLIERNFLFEIGGFDERMSTSADWELSCRIAHKTTFGYVPETLVIYHLHHHQMHKNISLMERDMTYGYDKLLRLGIIDYETYRRCKRHLYRVLCASYLKDDKNILKFFEYGIKYVMRGIFKEGGMGKGVESPP